LSTRFNTLNCGWNGGSDQALGHRDYEILQPDYRCPTQFKPRLRGDAHIIKFANRADGPLNSTLKP